MALVPPHARHPAPIGPPAASIAVVQGAVEGEGAPRLPSHIVRLEAAGKFPKRERTSATGYFVRPNSEIKSPSLARNLESDPYWNVELALDVNRVETKDDPSELYVHDTKRPLAVLLEAIKRVDESGDAYPIVLRHGDVLVVDNRRALICRKEFVRPHFMFTFARIQTKRWLRLYYGFPLQA